MSKVWQKSLWFYAFDKRSWCLTKAGECEIGERPEIKLEIGGSEIQQLITALDTEGWIKPSLDERLRTEDLEIIDRLLDIIELDIIERGKK